VTLGESHNGRVDVTSGLKGGEKVVTTGAIFVNEAGLARERSCSLCASLAHADYGAAGRDAGGRWHCVLQSQHRGLSRPGSADGGNHHPIPGSSAEEMERGVTIPIEVQLAGLPHMTAIRTISLFGLSDVKVQFTYDFTLNRPSSR
jgi:hypothetical protein